MKIQPMAYEDFGTKTNLRFDFSGKKEYSLPVSYEEGYKLGLVDNNDNIIYSNTD